MNNLENLYENCYDENKKHLNLSHRNLRSLDAVIIETFANCTEYLDLSHNRINNMSWIYLFPHLKCLIMDDNRLRESHFENLKQSVPHLHTLMLNKNELSDLHTTAGIMNRIFPNIEYLSLHGNAMCPDNLLLQPFSEFVRYEYDYYRTILLKSLPNLKFLDHFSLDSLKLKSQTAEVQNYQKQDMHHQQQRYKHLLTSTSKDLWSKVKSFLTVNSNQTTKFSFTTTNKCVPRCDVSFPRNKLYNGTHSEGNRYITNSDL